MREVGANQKRREGWFKGLSWRASEREVIAVFLKLEVAMEWLLEEQSGQRLDLGLVPVEAHGYYAIF